MSKKLRLGLIFFLVGFIFFKNLQNSRDPKVTVWDNLGYYAYLPKTFIEKDLSFSNIDAIKTAVEKHGLGECSYQFLTNEEGKIIPKYTIGLAILNAPAFLIGHAWAKIGGYEADGYSYPYQMGLLIWNAVLILLSFWILYKFLLTLFSEQISIMLVLIMAFGTNVYIHAMLGRGMPHLHIMFLYVLLLYFTSKWHKTQSKKGAFIVGVVLGLLVISRASEIVAVLIPLFWNVGSVKAFKERFMFFFQNYALQTICLLAGVFVFVFPQLFYWKMLTGQFFYFSYSDPAEGFEFSNPHVIDFLFGFRKGWFVYTPIMFLAFIGLIVGIWKRKSNSTLFLIFLMINVFILSCWSCWWFAASFGQRALLQTYPVYIVGLGFLVEYVHQRKKPIVIAFFTLCTLLVAFNQFQTWQIHKGILKLGGMTASYYWAAFGKTERLKNMDHLLLVSRDSTITKTIPHQKYYSKFADRKIGREQLVDNAAAFSEGIRMVFNQCSPNDHAWMKISFDYCLLDSIKPNILLVSFLRNKYGQSYLWFGHDFIGDQKIVPGEFKHHYSYRLIADPRLYTDDFNTYLWLNTGSGRIKIRNFEVESFIRRDH